MVIGGRRSPKIMDLTHDGRADMTNFEMDLFDTRISSVYQKEKDEDSCCNSSRNRVIKPACLPITIVAFLIITLVFLPLFNDEDLEAPDKMALITSCPKRCRVNLVETIPTGLIYENGSHNPETWRSWVSLLDNAEKYVEIAEMYWNLNSTEYPTAINGRQVFQAIVNAAQRGVKIRIAQNIPSQLSKQEETKWLAEKGYAKVRSLNFTALLGGGILHTKFMIIDMKHMYIGSANADWKSVAEVKELGIIAQECSCLAIDLYRIFAAYWRLGDEDAKVPAKWPISYRTPYNAAKPFVTSFNGKTVETYISSSPGPFNPKGREHDLHAIVGLIRKAKRTVSIAVMDYFPQTLYFGDNNTFWPDIDNAVRDAAFRGVHVRLLVSQWKHTRKEMYDYGRSLMALNPAFPERKGRQGKIEVKVFTVPSTPEQEKIPFARVNHNKYMTTDDTAYIGTSNWSGDYFLNTAGVALVITSQENRSIVTDLKAVFERDWNSKYSIKLQHFSL